MGVVWKTRIRSTAVAMVVAALFIAGTATATRASHAAGTAGDPAAGQAAAIAASIAASSAKTASPSQQADPRPNILLITSDDQRLRDMPYMPRTRRLIGDAGVTFHGVSPHPLCCPARAEILTGQFAQNNGVRSNGGPYGGYKRLNTAQTIAVWLQAAGYQTAFMGKYLNGYELSATPRREPGWDHWDATFRGVYNYTDFSVNHDGTLRTVTEGYQTDYYSRLAARKLSELAQSDRPFFLWQSFVAPHSRCDADLTPPCGLPPLSAPRHRSLFTTTPLDSASNPAFNEADVSDKPSWLSSRPLLTLEAQDRQLVSHRKRLRALQAVDEGVEAMLKALAASGELANTLVVFTSDNGFLMGEHRYVGKNVPYEQALRVPLLMRGPGIPAGVLSDSVAALVDLAPMFVSVSGAQPGVVMDGQNLLPVAQGREPGWESLLIQAGPRNGVPADEAAGWFFRGVRTPRYTYVEYAVTGESELYDRWRDPHELVNLRASHSYKKVEDILHQRLSLLAPCSGATCRTRFGPLPPPLAPVG